MSKINGDKARFHIARKRNIARRAQGRKLLESLAASGAAKEPVAKAKKS